MELFVISILLFASFGLLAYQFSSRKLVEEIRLPPEIRGETNKRAFDLKEILSLPAQFTDRLVEKGNIPLENLKRRLISAGRPINTSQFFAFKFLLMIALPFGAFILFHPDTIWLILALCTGYLFPDLWLNNKIKKRQGEVLRDLPHIIDLLNICVGAGLDFMVAVNRVIQEFRACVLVEELKILVHEIHMGSSRRDALKSLSTRINSPEMVSFVRTLLQADRMGTPIGEALKMQAEEIRIRRFQRGEEMALKAPIKLLAPLLFCILPVVLVIVAGPIFIQFTRGGFIKF
jgi:tight adherence protein C